MLLPLLVVLALAALWAAYWFIASAVARERFEAERATLSGQGLTLACTEETWGGFPFHFEFTCTSPVAKAEDRAEARSGRLHLVALAYAPWQVVALIDGPTTVSARGLVPTTAEHLRAIATLTFDRDWRPKLSAELPGLSVPGYGRAEKVMGHTRPSATGGTDIAISVTGGLWQPAGKPPLAIAQADLLGTLSDARELKVDTIAFEEGKVRYWGSGTLALDPANRLAGKLSTETNDLDGLLAILSPHLEMTESEKSGLRTMLGLLGNSAKAPVIAQDGALYVGPFKVADLLPLY